MLRPLLGRLTNSVPVAACLGLLVESHRVSFLFALGGPKGFAALEATAAVDD